MSEFDFDVAEMKPRMEQVMNTLEQRAEADGGPFADLYEHLEWLWENPDAFEAAEATDLWKDDAMLAVLELGVLFGIDYEQAYPEGRRDEWPIPIDERPNAGGSDGDPQ